LKPGNLVLRAEGITAFRLSFSLPAAIGVNALLEISTALNLSPVGARLHH
jgi:hypothetical protein